MYPLAVEEDIVTFSIPGTNEEADLLLEPDDRDELIQRLRAANSVQTARG